MRNARPNATAAVTACKQNKTFKLCDARKASDETGDLSVRQASKRAKKKKNFK